MIALLYLLCIALPIVTAFPFIHEYDTPGRFEKRQPAAVRPPAFLSNRLNTGALTPNPSFDAEAQYVNVEAGSGHEWQAPGPNDRRGPCPGLNAAANHGFLPRNGLTTIQQTITGLQEAYNLGADLSAVLAVVAIATSGDFLTQTWSIGGSFPSSSILLGEPKGLLGTHSKYEADTSPTRGDAYFNNGDVNVFYMPHWEHFYSLAEDSYTLDNVAAQHEYVQKFSINNNPYLFLGPILGAVASAAYNFVPTLFSNHSTESPGGTLTRDVLKSVYSVSGESGSFVHTPGHERIPSNWYKRPNQYIGPYALADLLINNEMYPGIISLGGNTNGVNTFVGVNTGDLTGGVYNAANLLEGNNLACFVMQASTAIMPDQLSGLTTLLGQLLSFVEDTFSPILDDLGCPQLSMFDNALFKQFPGAADYLD